ncbi:MULTISPECIES: peptidylprolyl isomerase [Haloferax]|uniref:Peptidyl-prolyl cis-trans isomerase n=1 Tax=Haloferax marinum TaxID=2666143 RepID=A0A6A8G7P4_9EURY|nr:MULTISPECIES: FKBP-type peptidyl-prolyl cis-trans isomerase [Haloferax]KAB1197818.1 peptidylprolyl isomerase [Haloferax sp. CBA1150]MRW96877.1 peptidylprolyl isomerase [Haloferax marinum]
MVEPGQIAIVHLTGRLVDGPDAGEVFETTDVDVALNEGVYHDHRHFMPFEFRVGEGHVISGLERAVREMSQGETQTVVLDPEEAYGHRDESVVVTVPRDELEARSDVTAEVDELVRSATGDVGWVVDVSDESVTIDFNHELAGERVEFEIRLLEVHATETGTNPDDAQSSNGTVSS